MCCEVMWVTWMRGCVSQFFTWVAWVTWVKIFFAQVNMLRGLNIFLRGSECFEWVFAWVKIFCVDPRLYGSMFFFIAWINSHLLSEIFTIQQLIVQTMFCFLLWQKSRSVLINLQLYFRSIFETQKQQFYFSRNNICLKKMVVYIKRNFKRFFYIYKYIPTSE